jgi:arginine exporter protein ArgO
MGEALLAGLLAGYGVAVPVGAIAIVVIGLTARTSLRVGAAAAVGVAAADGLYAALAVLGGAALAGLVRPVATPLRWSAVAILLLLAGQLTVGALRRHRGPAGPARAERALATPGRAFAGLLTLTLLNPMTIVYFVALVIGRQASGGWTPAGQAAFVAGAFVASASWQLLVAAGGSVLGRLLNSARGRLVTALLASALIVLLALRMIW